MTKALLVSPTGFLNEMPPISVITLASYLRNNGIEVKVADMPYGDFIYGWLSYFNPDIVGISGMTNNINDVYSISNAIRKSKIFTVIGGVHATTYPDEAKEYADAVVVGDGEKALLDIAKNKTEGIRVGCPVENLDELGIPAYDLIDTGFYTRVRNRVWNSLFTFVLPFDRTMAILTSRGCAFKCTFCYNSMKDIKYRCKSPKKIIEELKYLKKNYKIDSFHIHDDDFVVNKKRMVEFCELMKEEKLKLYWSCNARVSDITQDNLDILKSAGCVQFGFGLESHSQRILDIINKQVTTEQMDAALDLADKNGFVVQGSFMIGMPTETVDDIKKTVQFVNKHNIDGGLGLAFCTPYPGTKIYEWCMEKDLFLGKVDWNNFKYDALTVNMSCMPTQQLMNIRNEITAAFNNIVFNKENSRITKVVAMKKQLGVM
jgi:anaerobic magnesium-protoporphyrin IX monomethyl ester cyclase